MSLSIRHDPIPKDEKLAKEFHENFLNGPFYGIFAHGVETRAGARILHVSGQVGEPPEGELSSDFKEQCRQALLNVEEILKEADMTFKDIVKMTFYLVRREDIDGLLEIRKEMLDGVRPAVTTLLVAGLFNPNWFIEIDVVACAE